MWSDRKIKAISFTIAVLIGFIFVWVMAGFTISVIATGFTILVFIFVAILGKDRGITAGRTHHFDHDDHDDHGYYEDDDKEYIEESVEEWVPCDECGGRGEKIKDYNRMSGRPPDRRLCPACEGSRGKTVRKTVRRRIR